MTFRKSLITFLLAASSLANAADNDFTQATAAQLAAQLIGTSNVTLNGVPVLSGPASAASTFSSLNAGTLPGPLPLTLGQGIHLTIGTATGDLSGDTNAGFGGGTNFQGDTDLQAIIDGSPFAGVDVTDTTSLSFDFTVPPGSTSVSMDFIFGSQENPTSDWDVAGIIVDGVNYAFMPNGSILRVNEAAAINAYISPAFPDWRSWTQKQKLTALLNPNLSVHTIKIAVANTEDNDVTTGIFVSNIAAGTATQGGVDVPNGPQSIPTLSEWGMITLSSLLALGTVVNLRRRQ